MESFISPRLFNKIFVKTRTYPHQRHDDDDDADTSVDEPQTAQIEPRAHFIDDESDGKPPDKCSQDNLYISENVMSRMHLGQEKIESGKQSYEKEQYQRIGECKQKR